MLNDIQEAQIQEIADRLIDNWSNILEEDEQEAIADGEAEIFDLVDFNNDLAITFKAVTFNELDVANEVHLEMANQVVEFLKAQNFGF